MTKVYDVEVKDLRGDNIDLSGFRGRKLMIVNVASECGYTPQYAQLQELYQVYREKLVIMGCPCNDFGKQEPGTHEVIKKFCELNYGVSFPISQKMSITDHPHPLFRWLCNKSENGIMDAHVSWNFFKFLIDENGSLAHVFPSSVSPLDDHIIRWIDS